MIDYKTGGWLGGLVEGLRELIKVSDANTRIVPANGPVITKADLEAQREMYATISQRMNKLLRKGMGPEEVLAARRRRSSTRSGATPRASSTWPSRACGATSPPTHNATRCARADALALLDAGDARNSPPAAHAPFTAVTAASSPAAPDDVVRDVSQVLG